MVGADVLQNPLTHESCVAYSYVGLDFMRVVDFEIVDATGKARVLTDHADLVLTHILGLPGSGASSELLESTPGAGAEAESSWRRRMEAALEAETTPGWLGELDEPVRPKLPPPPRAPARIAVLPIGATVSIIGVPRFDSVTEESGAPYRSTSRSLLIAGSKREPLFISDSTTATPRGRIMRWLKRR